MRLKNQKASKFLLDNTWIPKKLRFEEDGSLSFLPVGNNNRSILTNPNGYLGLDYHDREMLKMGEKLDDILFIKALREYEEQNGQRPLQRKRKK